MRRFLLLLAAVLLLTGCAKKYDAAYGYESYDVPAYEMEEADYAYDEVAVSADSRSSRLSFKNERASSAPMPTSVTTPSADPVSADEPEQPATSTRMVHYNGYLQLRVTKTDESIEEIKALVEALGGYVESRSSRRVTVRVPVADFNTAMEKTMGLGDVLSRSVTAEDVTEAFTAIDLRLQTARATRDRLVELLAKATDEAEKIAILQQIQRVNEQIDVTESQLRTLSSLASFSRLTIELVPRQAFSERSQSQDAIGLGWIQALSPFRRDVGNEGRRVSVDTPDDFVVLSSRGRLVAESADGAVLWTGRVDNAPRGDADFWIEAISERLAPEFAESEITTVGPWKMVRFVADGEQQYRYLVGVIEEGKKLKIVEIYYPGAEQEERYGESILSGLRGGEG